MINSRLGEEREGEEGKRSNWFEEKGKGKGEGEEEGEGEGEGEEEGRGKEPACMFVLRQ